MLFDRTTILPYFNPDKELRQMIWFYSTESQKTNT